MERIESARRLTGRLRWAALGLALLATGCSFGKYHRLLVAHEEAAPTLAARLKAAPVVYVRELFIWRPGVAEATLWRPDLAEGGAGLEIQRGDALLRNDFAQRLAGYWEEQGVAKTLVMLPDGVPDPAGLVVRPVVVGMYPMDAGWSHATLEITDGGGDEGVYFARVDLPTLVGEHEARELFKRRDAVYVQSIAHAHLAWAVAGLVGTGTLPRSTGGRPTAWTLTQSFAAEAEGKYWAERARALPPGESTQRAYTQKRALDALENWNALNAQLSAACKGEGLTDIAACGRAEAQRLGRPEGKR